MGKRKKVRKPQALLDEDTRKLVAKQLYKGIMFKQVALQFGISLGYAYQIFNEFLEWQIEWKENFK